MVANAAKAASRASDGSRIRAVFEVGLVLAGLALLLGLVEAHVSTGGLVAGGGAFLLVGAVVCLSLAAGMALPLALGLVAVVGAGSGGAVLLVARSARSVRQLRPRAGADSIIGHIGTMRVNGGSARVFVDGSLWRARPSSLHEGDALREGERVVIEHVSGLTLTVRKAEEWELQT